MENNLQNKIEPKSETDSTSEVIQRASSRFLVIISIVPILVLILISSYIITHLEIFKISKLSSEPFDAAAALFSGSTLIFLIYGVWMQREELKDTKSLLREQKKISNAQEAALRKQNNATERQMFETTFFVLLKEFIELTNSLSVTTTELNQFRATQGGPISLRKEINGKSAFSHLDEKFSSKIYESIPIDEWSNRYSSHKEYDASYEPINLRFGGKTHHYFRTIYSILKFVSTSSISNKKFYTNILRAQMTGAEIKILAFNSASIYGREKMLPLIEEFSLLKHCKDKEHVILILGHIIKEKAFQ